MQKITKLETKIWQTDFLSVKAMKSTQKIFVTDNERYSVPFLMVWEKNMSYGIKILIVIKLFTSVCYLQKLLLPRTVYISNGNLYRFVPWMSTRISLTLFSFTCLIPLPLSTIRSVSEKIAKGKGLKIAYLRMSLYKNLYTYLTCLLDSIII